MKVLGWLVFAGVVLLAAVGVYRSIRLGLKAISLIATKGVVAALAAFGSYLLLSVLLGEQVFAGETFVSLSLILGVPLCLGMVAQIISAKIPKW